MELVPGHAGFPRTSVNILHHCSADRLVVDIFNLFLQTVFESYFVSAND